MLSSVPKSPNGSEKVQFPVVNLIVLDDLRLSPASKKPIRTYNFITINNLVPTFFFFFFVADVSVK
jgi:hypothetical protein